MCYIVINNMGLESTTAAVQFIIFMSCKRFPQLVILSARPELAVWCQRRVGSALAGLKWVPKLGLQKLLMFQDVDLKVLYISWEGVNDKMQSTVWTLGKHIFFQAIIEQILPVFPQYIRLNIEHVQQNIQQLRDAQS